jgi:hypothetical protein
MFPMTTKTATTVIARAMVARPALAVAAAAVMVVVKAAAEGLVAAMVVVVVEVIVGRLRLPPLLIAALQADPLVAAPAGGALQLPPVQTTTQLEALPVWRRLLRRLQLPWDWKEEVAG